MPSTDFIQGNVGQQDRWDISECTAAKSIMAYEELNASFLLTVKGLILSLHFIRCFHLKLHRLFLPITVMCTSV